MRETLFSWACLTLFGMFIFYMGWSFSQWQFNPGLWTVDQRTGYAGAVLIWMLVLAFFAFAQSDAVDEE